MNAEIIHQVDNYPVEFFVYHFPLHAIQILAHTHNKDQLLYSEGGIIHVFIEGKHWYLPARCFMWIPAGVEHSILTYSKKVNLYNFYFKHEAKENSFYHEPNIYFANDLLREMILYTATWFGPMDTENPPKYYFLKAIKENLAEMESTKLPLTIQHPFPKEPKLVEIAVFLYKNIDKDYTLEEIAKEFALSTRTLSRKFRDSIGMSYVHFLRSLRITKALELIAQNHYTMYEIALMIGYNSLSTFSNIFHKVTGLRPSEYAHILYHRAQEPLKD